MAKVRANPKTRRRTFIREWRKHRGLTLEQLAERIEVTAGALSQLERGLVNYTQAMLEALADELQTTPASLLIRNPGEDEIWSIWDNAQPGEKEQIVEHAKVIVRRSRAS